MSEQILMNQSRNTGKVSSALAQAQAEFGVITQNKAAYSFSYLDLAGILQHVLPILGKHNLSIVQSSNVEVNDGEPWAVVYTRLGCEDEWLETSISFPMMQPRKGMTEDLMLLGSTISYLKRYSLQSMLGISGADKQVEEIVDAAKDDLPNPNAPKLK